MKLGMIKIEKMSGQRILMMLVVMILSGCEGFLDVEPESVWESDSFYSNAQEAEIAMAGIYGVIASDEGYGRELIILNAGTDEDYYNRRFNENWGVSLFRNTSADDESFNFWTNQYQAINLTNLFIESIKPDSYDTEEEYKALLAEARFLRGLCHFNLTNLWNEIPLRLTSSKTQEDNNLSAAPLTEIYKSITDDLTYASANLFHPTSEAYTAGRAHKLAAHGLLARVYLKMSGYPFNEDHYQDVINHCDSVINDGFHGLVTNSDTTGYREVFLGIVGGVYNLKEVMFEISFQNLRDQGLLNVDGRYGALNGLNFGGIDNLGQPNGFGLAGVYPTLTFSDSDKRRDWNLANYKRTVAGDITPVANELVVRDYCPGKYRRWEPTNYADIDIDGGIDEPYTVLENSASELSRNFTSVNFPVLRYSDVLLMYAEASNELNGSPSAMGIQYLNEVRARAGLGDIAIANPVVTGDKQLFFEELVDERSRELCFEGVRRNDLIRWELLQTKLARVKNIVEGHPNFSVTNLDHVATLRGPENFDATIHLSLPYPLVEVSINQLLDQKIEWQ